MGVHEAGHAFGVVLLNSNALEIEFNEGIMIIRAQGGVFDFYIIVGENPTDVIQQYHTMIGKPFMPPYWAYGYQLSKWGYQDLREVRNVVRRNRALGIPYEIQYIDIGKVNQWIIYSFFTFMSVSTITFLSYPRS